MREPGKGSVVLISKCEADPNLVGEQATIEGLEQGDSLLYKVVLFDGDEEVRRLVLGRNQFIVLGK